MHAAHDIFFSNLINPSLYAVNRRFVDREKHIASTGLFTLFAAAVVDAEEGDVMLWLCCLEVDPPEEGFFAPPAAVEDDEVSPAPPLPLAFASRSLNTEANSIEAK